MLLFSAIIGSAAVAFPDYRQALVYALVAVLVGAVVLWQFLRISELQTENTGLKRRPQTPPPEPGWDEVLNVKLVLEDGDWKATSSFKVEAGKAIRVTAVAPKRFVLHLATDVVDDAPIRKRKFQSVERTPEAMQVTRTFEVAKAGTYAIVLAPAGISTFRADVKVERESEPITSSF